MVFIYRFGVRGGERQNEVKNYTRTKDMKEKNLQIAAD